METILSSKSATWYAGGDNSANEITSFDPQSIVKLNVTRTSGSGHFHEHGIDLREERGEEIGPLDDSVVDVYGTSISVHVGP
jgi:hypothetical protein